MDPWTEASFPVRSCVGMKENSHGVYEFLYQAMQKRENLPQDFNVDCEFLFNERVGWTALSEPEATASARRKWFHGRDASQVNWAGAR